MSVMDLQSKFFPIQPRGTLMSSSAGIFGTMSFISRGDGEEKSVMKLREPRDLYSSFSLQHPPKWPIECQVIPEKIRLIETAPAKLEHFYIATNAEPQPKPVGEEMGTVIYNYQPKLSVDYFCRSCVGGSEELQIFESQDTNTLKFESRFESGNLAKAIKVTNVYYELELRKDMYTDRHSQWFYFRIQNTKDNLHYRFSIVNFNKPDSLYRYGLKILMYSEKEAQLNKIGWVRCGQNIAYFKNDTCSEENGALYTLTFNLKFHHNNDVVYLAHCYPYTYSTLQSYLRGLEEDSFKSQVMTVRLLCRSLAGNNVYIVTITSPDNYLEESSKKPAILISARVHPGETQSSFMMKGIIDFLTSNCQQAQELRDRFIFKLIPMLNPDGVIVGNSRCCLLGLDLNRQYRTVLREAFPQIYHTKVLLRRLVEDNGVFLYCDIHGHSRRNNVFIYGCENRKFPEKRLIEQVFPLMMHKNAADKFSFQSCKFRIQKNKEGTGRVFAWTLGIVNSYTLEISLGGSTLPSRQYTHFNTADYEAIGRHFCETLMDYSDPTPNKEKLREKILTKLMEGGSSADEPVNIAITDYSSLSHSESDPEGYCDEETKKEEQPMIIPKKTRLLKKRLKPIPNLIKGDMNRPSLFLNKTSVDLIRITKTFQQQSPEESELAVTRELALFKRLTKFRRKSQWTTNRHLGSTSALNERDSIVTKLQPKCTRILFDDPFNPPGTFSYKTFKEGVEDDEYGSGTEDECDENDGTDKVFSPDQTSVVKELSLLAISAPEHRLQNCSASVPNSMFKTKFIRTTPFTPRLPEGKPLRSFYSIDNDDSLITPEKTLFEKGRRASSSSSMPKLHQFNLGHQNKLSDSKTEFHSKSYQKKLFQLSSKEKTTIFRTTESKALLQPVRKQIPHASSSCFRVKKSLPIKSKSVTSEECMDAYTSHNNSDKKAMTKLRKVSSVDMVAPKIKSDLQYKKTKKST